MTTVFIAGSISIKHLHKKMQDRISSVVSKNHNIVVGDADGADTEIQKFLQLLRAKKVTIYCTGAKPRNNLAGWNVKQIKSKAKPNTREFYTAKDIEMAKNSDFGLMIWDSKSAGTLNNMIELLKREKSSVVFIDKEQDFFNIKDKDGLSRILDFMEKKSRQKAEKKIRTAFNFENLEIQKKEKQQEFIF